MKARYWSENNKILKSGYTVLQIYCTANLERIIKGLDWIQNSREEEKKKI
jgi:hypothetical protein